MIELINELYLICEGFNRTIEGGISDNDDLNDMKELIDNHLSTDYQKLKSGMELFQELNNSAITDTNQEQYAEAYYNLLSGLSEISVYFDDFHRIVFNLNHKRRYRLGEISKEEYENIIDNEIN